MRKIGCFLLALVTAVSMVGCGGSKKETEPEIQVTEGTPVYEDNGQIERGAYCMPAKDDYWYPDTMNGGVDETKAMYKSHINEKEFRTYKEAGFTFMLTEYNCDWNMNEKFSDSSLYQVMETAEKVDIPIVVNTTPLVLYTGTNDYRISEDMKAYLQEMVSTLSTYQTFRGFSFRDEPKIEYAETFKAYHEYLKELKPDALFFTSFLPIYGAKHIGLTFDASNGDEEYAKYVDAYLEATNAFTYDYYPLRRNNVLQENYIMNTWFTNLDLVATRAKNYEDSQIGLTIQTSSFGPPGQKDMGTEEARTVLTKEDVMFQIYSGLAYGVKEFGYFTYWVHWGNPEALVETYYDAMVMAPKKSGEEGVKTDTYYAVQAANQELDKFDHVMLNFDWQGTMGVAPEGQIKSMTLSGAGKYEDKRIKEVSVSEETIIGCLKDGDGYDGYMIVNATEPSAGKTDKVTIAFHKATKALVYIHGEEQTITLENGSYTFDIGAGEGVFVIPIV